MPLPDKRCCNCGARRDDLIEHDGDLWCPGYGDCDWTLYQREALDELSRLSQEFEGGYR